MNKLARFVGLMAVCGCGVAFAQQGTPGEKTVPEMSAPASRATPAPAAASVAKPAEATMAADPAIWRAKGAHGAGSLVGSVHVMKPNVVWESAKVKAALESSDVLYLEIANIDDTASVQPMVLQFGIDTDHPLSTKVSKDDLELLDAAAKG